MKPKPLTAAFLLTCFVSGSASAQISNIAITSAADYSLGVPAPAGIAAIFCTGLSITGVQTATSFPLPTILAGVQVTIGGFPAPLYAVASVGAIQQINLQVPTELEFDIASDTTTTIVITQGSLTGTANPYFIYHNPGQFFSFPDTDPRSVPSGIFQRTSDYSLITNEEPARGGDTLIVYGSGFVALSPLPPDGLPAPVSPLSEMTPEQMPGGNTLIPETRSGWGILDIFQLVIDGTTVVTPLYMGLSPGGVGLGQINFVVPPLASGSHQLQIQWIHDEVAPAVGGVYTYLSKPVLLPVQ